VEEQHIQSEAFAYGDILEVEKSELGGLTSRGRRSSRPPVHESPAPAFRTEVSSGEAAARFNIACIFRYSHMLCVSSHFSH